MKEKGGGGKFCFSVGKKNMMRCTNMGDRNSGEVGEEGVNCWGTYFFAYTYHCEYTHLT